MDLDLLTQLTLAHTQSIAFENLNTLLRVPVLLDIASLEAKLIKSVRGGYCFEQNSYFAAVLELLGFSVQRFAARVLWGSSVAQSSVIPRAHMVLLVSLHDRRYLCDVGFGGITPTVPLVFELESVQQTPHDTYRIVEHENAYLLQARIDADWLDVYLFDLQPQCAIDYEVANHYVATHPLSHFRYTLMAARAFDGGRYHLRNRRLTTFLPAGEKQQRELRDAGELEAALREKFGVEVPDTAAFEAALRHIREG